MSKDLAKVCAVLAFLFCLAGGLVVLNSVGFDFFSKDNGWVGGLGLYFIGKAIFVGAMILLTTSKNNPSSIS